jgi:hypothetical protein
MPGYSVEWGHKAPKTIVRKEPALVHNTISHSQPVAAKGPNNVSGNSSCKEVAVMPLKHASAFHPKNISSNSIESSTKKIMSLAPNVAQSDTTHLQFFTGDEQLDDHARKSLIYGLFAWGFAILGYLVLFVIVVSTGASLASPVTYAIVIFLIGCAIGIVFAVLALIQGITALNEINSQSDLYYGKGDAFGGMALAIALPALLLVYFLLKDL